MHHSRHDKAPSSGYIEGRIKRLFDAVATTQAYRTTAAGRWARQFQPVPL